MRPAPAAGHQTMPDPRPAPLPEPPPKPPHQPPPQPPPQPPLKPPPLRHDSAAADRYCDVVLTGGVTSGIVYPLALLELARHYRFKNIGGTSAGAMAAALAAAAELARRHGSLRGFEVLRRLPGELAANTGGVTRMQSLFQPAPGTARLLALLLRVLAIASPPPGGPRRQAAARVLAAVLSSYARSALWGLAWVGAALALLAFCGTAPGWLGSLLGAGLGALVGVGVGVWRDVTGPLVANGFGICSGRAADEPGSASGQAHLPALVDWLHSGIQAAAGRPAGARAVTFGDLWAAPGGPPDLPGSGQPQRSIDLRVISSNLTLGRPIQWPLDGSDPANRLFFDPVELARYLPSDVLAQLVADSRLADPVRDGVDTGAAAEQGEPADDTAARARLRRLPEADLPLLLAARLSLSFPILLSAVPLWALDEEAPRGQRLLRRCWFSDGGLCANFPIHLFDAAVPRWPTFGIALGRRSSRWSRPRDAVWLPRHHSQGRADAWHRFDDQPAGAGRLMGFLGSLLHTAKDWHDHTQMRLPGVRDRVVRIGFEAGEGELNLGMTARQMQRIARLYGRRAGKMLVRRFVPPPGDAGSYQAASTASQRDTKAVPAPGAGWPEHRWVRFNLFTSTLRQRLAGLGAATGAVPGSPALGQQLSTAFLDRPLAGHDADGIALSASQADALAQLLQALTAAEAAFAQPGAVRQPFQPTPPPVLTVRPPV